MVKEADALSATGYNVTVIYAYWNAWGTRYDDILLPSRKWKAVRAGGDPDKKASVYLASRIIHKISRLLFFKLKLHAVADWAMARSSFFLHQEVKKHKADIYIGHNLGALPATVKAAKANKKPCGFDAEDYHRFEGSDDVTNQDVVLNTFIEDKYIPQLNYLSTSSPLITEAYHRRYTDKKPVTLLNVFPPDLTVKTPVINPGSDIKLFWFSQTIGNNRGIESIVNALKLLKGEDFELHLLGNISDEAKQEFIDVQGANELKVFFHPPVASDALINFASQFDIGFATENSEPYNRDICLTNKIFTYMQAGLAIVATNTSAQQKLMSEYPAAGKIYSKGDSRMLANILAGYNQDREKLLSARKESLAIGRNILNWDIESIKLINLVQNVLRAYHADEK